MLMSELLHYRPEASTPRVFRVIDRFIQNGRPEQHSLCRDLETSFGDHATNRKVHRRASAVFFHFAAESDLLAGTPQILESSPQRQILLADRVEEIIEGSSRR